MVTFYLSIKGLSANLHPMKAPSSAFAVLLFLLLMPAPLHAQGTMPLTEQILSDMDAEELRDICMQELKVAKAFVDALPELGQEQPSAAQIDALILLLADWEMKRSARIQAEESCHDEAAKRSTDWITQHITHCYVTLSQGCEQWLSMGAQTPYAPLVEGFKRMLPDMPCEEERLRERDAIAALVLQGINRQQELLELLNSVKDVSTAKAAAAPFLTLVQQSQAVDLQLSAYKGEWLTLKDRDFIRKPSLDIRLHEEAQRIIKADFYGSEVLRTAFAQVQVL